MRITSGQSLAAGVTLLVVIVFGAAVAVEYIPTASNQGYAPEQPIPFSHKIHAGDRKIACNYCHIGTENSRHATVPALSTCMNCHQVVKTDSPHIQRMTAAFKDGKPVEWIRVHELPDFVYFPHKRHIAKGISCETCHGDVKSMDRLSQHAPLTMGWCMQCHRGETAPSHVLADKYPNQSQPSGPVAPTDCSTCHN